MNIKTYLNAPIPRWVALVTVVATSVAAGGGSYYYFQKRFNDEFETELRLAVEEEVANTTKFYAMLRKEEYPTANDAAEELLDAVVETTVGILTDEGYTSEKAAQGLTEVVRNVFTNAAATEWDADAEEAQRDPSKPYILEHDEFYSSENQSVTLNYFEGDNTLSDEKDEHIADMDGVVGEENLSRFGHGSRDPNVLYVRNETLDLDFEIVRNDGKYTEQVLGFIQHEDRPSTRRFRFNDE